MRAGCKLLKIPVFAVLLTGGANTANPAGPPKLCDYAMIVLDASGSMNMNSQPKMAYAREAVHQVVPEISDGRALGLIIYGDPPGGSRVGGGICASRIALSVPPRENATAAILEAVDAVSPQGMTPLTEAVALAANAAGDGSAPAAIILVTDGQENCGGNPCELGKALRASKPGTAVHVIGLGFSVEADRALSCLAAETGGTIREVKDAESLGKALRDALQCPAISELPSKGGLAKALGKAYPNG